MSDSDDLDMGELILPEPRQRGASAPKKGTLLPWFVPKGAKQSASEPPKCSGKKRKGSNAPGKRPMEQSGAPAKAPKAPKPNAPAPSKTDLDPLDREHVDTVSRELERIRGHVMGREEENNAAYKKNEYPKWRLVPPKRLPAVATATPSPATPAGAAATTAPPRPTTPPPPQVAVGRNLLLNRLLSCDDDEQLKKHGAVLVTYADFVRASNEKVDVTLLGAHENDYDSNHKISYGNRESVSFNYAVKNLAELITSVPAFNGDHRLTGMQRLATALMTGGYDKDVNIMIKSYNLPVSHLCDACYRLPPHTMPNILINNLTVAAGKTRATIFSTMRHIATPEAWKATQAKYTAYRLAGYRQGGSGLYKADFVDEAQTKMARVIIALVPAPVMQQWTDASMKLASTFKENAWITWTGLSPIKTDGGGRGGKKSSKPRNLPAAIDLTTERRCALFWVMEANTKSSSAALFTATDHALPYRIIDEGTGCHLTEPRTRDKQSPCRHTILCNATLEQLKDHTNQQPKHPLRRAMDGCNLNLNNSRHCAIATLCSLPSWLRLVTGLSMAPLMPEGILKICMRVQVKSLAGSMNRGSDMVLTSTDDLIQGLILDGSSSMTTKEKEDLTKKCRLILNRADPDTSIVDNLAKAITDVEKDEKSLAPMPRPLEPGGMLTQAQQEVAEGIRRYQRVYATMKRLFRNLRTALCPDPPPECPITLDAIEPENVCILSCCTTIIDKESLPHITNGRCPMCRAPIKNVASASQAADAIEAATKKKKKPEPDPEAAAPAPVVRLGNTESLVAAFRHAAGSKCNSSLEAVVRTLEVALQFKPKGLRVLLCCNVWGGARSYNASLDEEKNTYRTCDFLRRALPQLTSVCTIGKGPKSKLPQYKAFDDSNRLFIIDTSARSTTMAGLDLPETDIILFDRLGDGGKIDLAKIVQSIGRAMRAQKKGLEENQADHVYFRKHGRSRHAPKIVVFIDKYKKPKPPPPPGLPELPEGQVYVEAAPPRYGTPPGHADDQVQSSSDDDGAGPP